MAKVVNIKKEKCDVYIGRGSIFGNPYTHIPKQYTKAQFQVKTRQEAIDKYREYFYKRIEEDSEFLDAVLLLKGKTLGCYCKPLDCHGDIILQFLEKIWGFY